MVVLGGGGAVSYERGAPVRAKFARQRKGAQRWGGGHQPPEVNYFPRFKKGDFSWRLHEKHAVCRVNHHSRNRVDSSLQVVSGGRASLQSCARNPEVTQPRPAWAQHGIAAHLGHGCSHRLPGKRPQLQGQILFCLNARVRIWS